ncbi:MAG: hypothetical protein MZV70_39600 [Desulfobacterales bacterium]|nr:hypothetical protein [Desulfobacterales bacterium]
MPAYYKLFVPVGIQGAALARSRPKARTGVSPRRSKDVGADAVYSAPAGIQIDRYQATLLGSVIGSRGDAAGGHGPEGQHQALDAAGEGALPVTGQGVERGCRDQPGRDLYRPKIKIRDGLAPGKYTDRGGRGQRAEERAGDLREQDQLPAPVSRERRHQPQSVRPAAADAGSYDLRRADGCGRRVYPESAAAHALAVAAHR